uniref:non-specific serine/threonine protein kinase n=1 Tax=Caenorhabditis japonica TaxID=281687 RepID=A0A8R1HIX4_CAEJA
MKTSTTGVISVNCALSVAIQIFEALEDLHTAGFIHRDMKPSNVCFGRKDRGEQGKVFLLSFGISRKYLDGKNQMRRPRENVEFRGTVRYASLACHQLQELSRKDDLESTLYVLAEMMTGQLPWKGLPDGGAVMKTKQNSRFPPGIYQLFRGACPIDELRELLGLIDTLTYYSNPDYGAIYNILRRAMRRNTQPEHPYDWEIGGTNPLGDL